MGMIFNRGGRGGGRGFSRGRGGGGRGGGRSCAPAGPPDAIVEVGEVTHASEDDLVCKCTMAEKVPYFNGRVFLSNKQEIGKVDEIFGKIRSYMFSVKLGDAMKAASFKPETKLYIDPLQTLPLTRFIPGSGPSPTTKGIGRGGGPVRGRGGRGGSFRGRGGSFSGGFRGRGRGRGS